MTGTKLTKWVAGFASAALLCSCAQQGHKVTVSNTTDRDRAFETIELSLESLGKVTAGNAVVTGKNGEQIPCQVYTDTDGKDKLVFQASVPAKSSATFTVSAGVREDFPTVAYSRYVPERLDDYAYENNLVAGRIYGPALEDPRTFGSDIWLKCTERLILNEWFAKADYHHNYGEGMDCYKVAQTLGGGALVPYTGSGKFYIGDNYATQKHICDGPVRTKAIFEYGPLKVDGKTISATREISLDANSRFVKSVTTFHCPGTDSLDVVLGAVMHDVVGKDAQLNWIAFTEKASDSSDPDRDGNISVAIVYDKAELDDNPYYTSGQEAGHAVIITREKTEKPIAVWTGSGWSQGGVESHQAWTRMVEDFAFAQKNPLKVTVK